MEFARNPPASTTAIDLLRSVAPNPTEPLWLMVDGALVDPVRLRTLMSSLRWDASNALQGTMFDAFGELGPRLIALPADRGDSLTGLRRLIEWVAQAPAVSVIASAAPRDALTRLCAYLAEAQVDGDLPLHCRFADTRVLPELLHALSARQASRVTNCVSGWAWHDHLGKVAHWNAAAGNSVTADADTSPHLTLDAAQFAAMLDASEPDTMFLMLLENTPELVPASDRGPLRDRLASILTRANRRRLVSPNDRLQYVVLSLSCGDSFDEHPGLQSTWAAVAEQGATLLEEMKGWSDSLWAELPSHHSSTAP